MGRRRNWWRLPASIVLCLIGTCFFLLLNGQTFTNSLVFLLCWATSLIIWFPEIRRSRYGIQVRLICVLGLHLVAIAFVCLGLRYSYEFQKNFNDRVKPAGALQKTPPGP